MENLSGQSERSHATPYRALRIVNRHAAAGVGVSPDLKVYTISDPEALSELVARLHLDSTLASNLREVLGLQTVGNGGCQGRQMAGNWPRLHSVVRSAPAQTRARSGRGQQFDPHFQTLLMLSTDSRRALT